MCTNWRQADHPLLVPGAYRSTSPCTTKYNCIAWAVGDSSRWWEPDPYRIAFWPRTATRRYTVEAYIEAFASEGFHPCSGAEPESGLEKIALFGLPVFGGNLRPTHAARLLPSGSWTSKLGPCEDVEHFQLESVNGPVYGSPIVFLSRAIVVPSAPLPTRPN